MMLDGRRQANPISLIVLMTIVVCSCTSCNGMLIASSCSREFRVRKYESTMNMLHGTCNRMLGILSYDEDESRIAAR